MDSKKRKPKDKEKDKDKERDKDKSKEKMTELATKIDETDEMKLKMLAALDAPDPEDVLYPPELNAHLIEQLKVMTGENNGLRKTVFEKDESIRELNKTITELNQRIRDIISGTGPTISCKSAGIISQKITNLCRQNRHLISELEHYKSKNGSLARKIMQLELLTKEQEKFEPCLCKEELIDASSDELKELNLKLANVNKKLYDSKNKNLELKNEILLATKILQQELGDKFTSIKELQCDVAGWKGRAQQITLLQAKIAELEEKLNIAKRDKDNKKDFTNQGQTIKDIEAKKKKETEQAMKEFEALKLENQELKKKIDAAKCRIRNLECDVTTIRQKMQTFAEKSKHDDMLINEQRNEIKTVELYYQEVLKENTSKMNKMNADIAEHQKSTKSTESKIDALRKQANEKAAKIDELRAQLLRYEECSLQSVFFTPMKTATDNEIKKLSELVVKLNERLDSERHKWEEIETSNRKLKERKRRLERRINSLEEELKALQQQESKRGSRASKISLPSYDFGGTSTPAMKKKPSIAAVTEKNTESSSSESQPEIYDNLDKEELKFKLELTEEKLKIMEDKLKMIEEEKLEDFNHLTEMIQTSKQLFNEALGVLQKERCICPTCPT